MTRKYQPLPASIVDAMTAGYLECAEWADKPEESRARFPQKQKDIARIVMLAFCEYAGPFVAAALATGMPVARLQRPRCQGAAPCSH